MKFFTQTMLRTFALTAFFYTISLDSFTQTEIDGIYYNLDSSSKTAEVTKPTSGTYTKVTIPSIFSYNNVKYTVTSIGEKAFYSSKETITSVSIPKTITTIGKDAFSSCSNLEAVYIESLTKWCNISFGNANSSPFYAKTTKLYVSNEAVTELEIPDSVTSISNFAFKGCRTITSVTIPANVTTIGDNAFQTCSFQTLTLNEGLTTIGASAFTANDIVSIVIPNSVTSIGKSAFLNCRSLTSVTLPTNDSFTTINEGTFSGCSALPSITIPSSVTSIGNKAFSTCSTLTSITIPSSVTTIDMFAFQKSGLTTVKIPSSITIIDEYTFSGCASLTSVTIPSSVTDIKQYAFKDCSNLAMITFEGTTPPSTKYSAFSNCKGVTNVTVPKGYESNYKDVYIGSINAYEIANIETVLTTDVKWATGCLDYDAVIPDGTTAYYVSAISDGKITLSEFAAVNARDTVIPAKEGFIYNADAGSYQFKRYAGTSTVPSITNKLTGVLDNAATVEANSVYVLSKVSDTAVGFRLYTGTSIDPNHAYLDANKVSTTSASRANSLAFDFGGGGGTTGITPSVVEPQQQDDAIYNLQGQRVSTMQRGHIYIKGGKKIICK